MSTLWWKRAVVYQIYPRSFQDSDGDGVGDLKGLEARLDHLVTLGVDALWISPIYPSPMADFGYDVSDHCGIDPRFGTLADFDRLLAAAHERGLRVLLDFVPNHTSDQHPWFLESKRSRSSPTRGFYIWRDPATSSDGVRRPPNNWISDFGGSAWEWDAPTGQYYLHAFLKEQPDLDWRNPSVRDAMYDVLRFWFARGVDGFRIDVLWHLIKADGFPDNPPNPAFEPAMGEMHRLLQLHSTDQPEVHGIAREMRLLADDFGERVLIGEVYLPLDRLMRYYGSAADGVHLPFNFQLIDAPWNARGLEALIAAYEAALPKDGWPNWVLGNHDRPRVADRLGEAQARVAAMLLLTLRGTPTLYYGDELGIGRVTIPPSEVKDPLELLEPGLGRGRDPVRTPMPWDGTALGGFTTGESSWLPLNQDSAERNVAVQTVAAGSMLNLHRALLALRRAHPALSVGALRLLDVGDAVDVLAYERFTDGERLLVALNLRGVPQELALPAWASIAQPLVSTLPGPHLERRGPRLTLRPDEGIVLGIRPPPSSSS